MNVLNSMSIKAQLSALVAGLILALAGSMGLALMKMNSIGGELEAIAEELIPMTNAVTEITINQLEQAVNFERALRYGEEIGREENAEQHFQQALNHFEALTILIEKELKYGEEFAEESIANAHSDAEKNEFKHVLTLLTQIDKEHQEYVDHVEKVFALLAQGNRHEAVLAAERVEEEEENIDHELEGLLAELGEFTQKAADTAEQDEHAAMTLLSILTVTVSVIALFAAAVIIRSINNGLASAIGVAQVIASGDLSREIKVEHTGILGDLEKALKDMREGISLMITELKGTSTDLSTAGGQLSAITTQTNVGIHEQKSQVTQIATAVTEMSATVQEVAQSAAATAEAANEANDQAREGQGVVQNTIESIQALAQGVGGAADAINQVGHDSDSIGKVIDVIKGIAEQTNLLALNAAIEAARAGEQGRGFAVVADEVRTLAQRTQESTAEIEEMIVKLQNGAKNAVTVMETGRRQAKESVEHASQAGASLEKITSAVNAINDMNIQIASASEEQSSVSEEINQNLSLLNDLAEQNTGAVNETSTVTESVATMVDQLQVISSRFKA